MFPKFQLPLFLIIANYFSYPVHIMPTPLLSSLSISIFLYSIMAVFAMVSPEHWNHRIPDIDKEESQEDWFMRSSTFSSASWWPRKLTSSRNPRPENRSDASGSHVWRSKRQEHWWPKPGDGGGPVSRKESYSSGCICYILSLHGLHGVHS